jgi:hypothetical protein
MGKNLENKKKLMPVQIMNSAGLNSKNIVISAGNFNVVMILIVIPSNNIGMNNVPKNISQMSKNSYT